MASEWRTRGEFVAALRESGVVRERAVRYIGGGFQRTTIFPEPHVNDHVPATTGDWMVWADCIDGRSFRLAPGQVCLGCSVPERGEWVGASSCAVITAQEWVEEVISKSAHRGHDIEHWRPVLLAVRRGEMSMPEAIRVAERNGW